MRLETRPVGSTYAYEESTVSDLNWGSSGLRLVVEYWNRTDSADRRFVEYYFDGAARFRLLEEIDLVNFWSRGVHASGHLLFEVLAGGWLTFDASGERLFTFLTKAGTQEWIIYTSNWSASVISSGLPRIRDL